MRKMQKDNPQMDPNQDIVVGKPVKKNNFTDLDQILDDPRKTV